MQPCLPKELLLPKCGIGTKLLNLRCTQYINPAFPPPGECAAILFINNISCDTFAFSLENSSLDFQVGLNLSTLINAMARAPIFLPESNLFRLVGILAGTSQPWSHGAAILTNPSRVQAIGRIPELQEVACFSWASNQSLGATKLAWCVYRESCCSHDLMMFPRQLRRRDRDKERPLETHLAYKQRSYLQRLFPFGKLMAWMGALFSEQKSGWMTEPRELHPAGDRSPELSIGAVVFNTFIDNPDKGIKGTLGRSGPHQAGQEC